MSESLIDPAWRERDHNPISATIVGGTHQDLSALSDSLSMLNDASLFAFDTSQELLANQPAKPLTLLVLHSPETAQEVSRLFRWAKRSFPHCVLAVVSDEPAAELDAREHGALYFRPEVEPWQWAGLLESAQQINELICRPIG
jgi:hypothetical protein